MATPEEVDALIARTAQEYDRYVELAMLSELPASERTPEFTPPPPVGLVFRKHD